MNSADADPVAVVSPHLDDAVLSAGAFLASRPGSVIVTVFAAGPHRPAVEAKGWDESCGFKPGADVIAERRLEDRAAASLLGCKTRYLDCWDSQYRSYQEYGGPVENDEIVADVVIRLECLLSTLKVSAWLGPLGYPGFHDDHSLTRQACLPLAKSHQALNWMMYADLPYFEEQNASPPPLPDWSGFGYRPHLVTASTLDFERKHAAVDCYVSQCKGLNVDTDRVHVAKFSPERFWSIHHT